MEDEYGFGVPQMQWYDESRNPYVQGFIDPVPMVEQASAPLPEDYEIYPDFDFSGLSTTSRRSVNSDYLNYLYKKLRKAGYDDRDTAAVLGQIAEKSGGDPFAVGKRGSAFGILGWAPSSYRINTFMDDDPYRELNRQLKYFLSSGDIERYKSSKEDIPISGPSTRSQIYSILTADKPQPTSTEPEIEWTASPTPEEWRKDYRQMNPEQVRQMAVSDVSKRLRQLENNKANPSGGYNKRAGRWYPHDSFEGGAQTIAYGIKLSNGLPWAKLAQKQGYLTDAQAEEALQEMSGQYYDNAKKVYDKQFGEGEWDKLNWKQQSILTDYEYNVAGGLKKFPALMRATREGDIDTMLKESSRSSGGRPLKNRNAYIAADIDALRDLLSQK